jgi:hypothetical protein
MSPSRLLAPALLAVAAGAASAADSNLQIHGLASQGYLETSGNSLYGRSDGAGTFELNEFALNATATPIERVRIGVQVLAYDLGKYGNDKPQIDWAFGEYQVPTNNENFDFSVVGGRFKTGHGLYNDYRDLDMTRTSVFLPSATYSATLRDVYLAANGLQLNATVRCGKVGSFDLSGYVGTQNIDANEGPIADNFQSLGIAKINSINLKRADGGHINWNTPIEGLRVKGSLLHAANLVVDGENSYVVGQTLPFPGGYVVAQDVSLPVHVDLTNYQDFMFGAEYQTGDWTFASEFSNIYYRGEVEATAPSASNPLMLGTANSVFYSRQLGAYGSINYQLSALPAPWNRLQVFGAANWLHDEENHDPVTGYHRGLVAAIRYDIADHFLVKAEFQRNRGTLLVNSSDNPDGTEELWNLFSLKTSYDF